MLTLLKEAAALAALVTALLMGGMLARDMNAQFGGESSGGVERAESVIVPVRDLSISGDGRFLVTHFDMSRVVVRDTHTGQILAEINPEIDEINGFHSSCIAVSEATGQIMIGFSGGTIYRGSHPASLPPNVVQEHRRNLQCSPIDADFSPDGRQIAIGTQDDVLMVLSSESLDPEWSVPAHRGTIFAVRYAADGRTIYTAAGDGFIRQWDSATGELVSEIVADVGLRAVEVSPDGELLTAVSNTHIVVTWDVRTGEELWRSDPFPDMPLSLAFSPDSQMIACGLHSGVILLSNARSNLELARITGHRRTVSALQFLDDRATLVSGSFDSTVRFWNISQRKEIKQFREVRDEHAFDEDDE